MATKPKASDVPPEAPNLEIKEVLPEGAITLSKPECVFLLDVLKNSMVPVPALGLVLPLLAKLDAASRA